MGRKMLTVSKTDKNARHASACVACGKQRTVRAGRQNTLCSDCSRSKIGKANATHGMHNTRIYRIHKSMMQRCGQTNTKHKFLYLYADRNIKVCQDWKDFENFLFWANNSGYNENLEIDRIDNNLGYFPDNCRWVTHKENMQNRRPRSEWKQRSENHDKQTFLGD